jgi:hypothetical protein
VKLLERVGVLIAALALSAALIALLSGFFTVRDQSAVAGARPPGIAFRDLGDTMLAPGQLGPTYDSDPPTSGAHVPQPIGRDDAPLSDEQLLQALSLGDVVVAYGTRRPPAALVALARSVAGPFTPSLAAAGQAVILDFRQGTAGLIGLAWAHMIQVRRATQPLREFAQYWLGRGATAR